MKGVLFKTENGWQVNFVYRDENHFSTYWPKQLPLHPNECKFWRESDFDFYNGTNAEFDIFADGGEKYARFLHRFTNEIKHKKK